MKSTLKKLQSLWDNDIMITASVGYEHQKYCNMAAVYVYDVYTYIQRYIDLENITLSFNDVF
jgi:hypothetical protein